MISKNFPEAKHGPKWKNPVNARSTRRSRGRTTLKNWTEQPIAWRRPLTSNPGRFSVVTSRLDCWLSLVGLVGERLTAGVLGTLCGWCSLGPVPWFSWVIGFSSLWFYRAVSLRFPPTSGVVYGPRSGGRPLLILRFPCLWPFSLLLCSARFWTHCIQLRCHSCSLVVPSA